MTIVAIANACLDGAMRERFHAEPIIQATELLLQERVPREVASTRPWATEVKSARAPAMSTPRRTQDRLRSSIHAGDTTSFQRKLCRDDDSGRLRIQPVGRCRHHAMA